MIFYHSYFFASVHAQIILISIGDKAAPPTGRPGIAWYKNIPDNEACGGKEEGSFPYNILMCR